ncbi:hypothetical protein K440DRAFT_550548 [Wilcoxina mikolae CBS 423.85]|nr:hypothetical protein K440DRAFT_550548 [Wilcoxina mikolae CBS 423.85]
MPHRDNSRVFSIWTTRQFLKRELNLVVCAGTKAAQKLSITWVSYCEKSFFRLIYSVITNEVHEFQVVNIDQTGMILIAGGGQRSYEEFGAQQVLIHGKGQKRAFTAVLATALDGTVLPVQSFCKGKTQQSLLEVDLENRKSHWHIAEIDGHRFALNPNKHWSSLHITQEWFRSVLEPHRLRMILLHDLQDDAKLVVYIDCWSVHRGKELAAWLKITYKWSIIIFVPAN